MVLYFIINTFVILIFVALYFLFRKTDKKWSNTNDYLGKVANTVNSVRYGNLATKLERIENPSYQQLSESINRMVETLNDREQMIIEYQSELTRQNRFLEAVINSLSDGILIIDESYKISKITPKITNWFKDEEKNIIGKNLFDYIQIKDETNCESLKESEIFVKAENASYFEATSTELVLDDKKKRYVVIIKDTTNQKELEKLREDFVATLTHDLKVPIIAESNILDFLISAKFGEVNEKQFEAISNIRDSNQELLGLVQILLETYKINEAGIVLDKQPLNLSNFIKEIVDEMQPIAEKSGFKINFSSTENIEISADQLQLKRVVKNLIQNAISHSESNKDVDIEAEQNKENVSIKIIDYGKGIPKEDLEKIFDKYYSTAKKFRKIGTGLGLYLSQQIIKAHGGEIKVSSEENASTEFCINLTR